MPGAVVPVPPGVPPPGVPAAPPPPAPAPPPVVPPLPWLKPADTDRAAATNTILTRTQFRGDITTSLWPHYVTAVNRILLTGLPAPILLAGLYANCAPVGRMSRRCI